MAARLALVPSGGDGRRALFFFGAAPLVTGQCGYGELYSLLYLLPLNGGAIVGGFLVSRGADRFDPRRVIATMFVLAAPARCPCSSSSSSWERASASPAPLRDSTTVDG
ncbi:hypothetical protein [Streptomyces phaeochromogenes]